VKMHWWLRLRWYEWRNAWLMARARRTAGILSWALPCLFAPLALRLVGSGTAAQDFILSFDIPLALLLAVVVTVQATPAAVRAPDQNGDAWLLPLPGRRRLALLQRTRDNLRAARWPLRFALMGFVLCAGNPAALTEWLLITLLAFIAGILLARVHAPSPALAAHMWSGSSRGAGLAALSVVPLRAAWRQLDLRRALFLCVPILLAAPMGTPLYKIASGVAVWMPLVYLASCCREAANAVTAMRRWLPLPRMQLHWWVWRHVVLLMIATMAAAWTLWQFGLLGNSRSRT
jgi:hypothetical protein